jgi:hypothetical protein
LEYDHKYVWIFFAVCSVGAAYGTWRMGYRDAAFIFITIGGTILLSLVSVFLQAILVPPKYRQVQGNAFDKALSLFGTNKSDAGKKSTPE